MVAPLTGAREDAAVRSPADATGSVVVRVADEPTPAWLDGWLEVKVATAGGVDVATAAQILRASPALYLSAEEHDGVVGVVRLALAGHWAGISSLTVRTRARRRGIGRLLTCAALDGAVEHGASAAFLQVEESNRAAVGLYEGLGFGVADRYHYRQR
jgi:ribosomal protein S18 acetylase RimI-like enzyme